MHILIGLVGIAITAFFFLQRMQRRAEVAKDIFDLAKDVPGDVRAAARRWGFKRRTDVHPVEAIEEPRLAIAGLGAAFIELDDLPTAETRKRLDIALRKHLEASAQEAEEMAVLGAWFVRECGGPDAAISRMARKLHRMDQGASFARLMAVIGDVSGADLSRRQSEALTDIKRAFHLS